jgi:hypothetical protein
VSAVEAETSVQDHPRVRAKRPRSAVTSGRKAFIAGDPNSAWARRFHDLVQGHLSDLSGRSNVSEAKFALCKRAAGLECELEQMEGRMSLGEEVDLDAYGRGASHLRRILETLGLERKCRDVTLIDGKVEAPFSPMRSRWAEAEAAAAAKREGDTADTVEAQP